MKTRARKPSKVVAGLAKREIGNLIKACRKGDGPFVTKVLQQGVDPNILAELSGSRPLTAAVRGGHLKLVKMLLDAGADPNAKDSWKSMPPEGTPLENAARSGYLEVAKLLVDRGAKLDLKGDFTPIESAAAHGHPELVSFLLNRGASFDSLLLMRAVRNGNIEVIRLLIGAGADVNCENEDRLTPIHLAAVKDNDAVVKELITAGASLDVQTKHNMESPLILAAQRGAVSIVEALLKAGADATLRGLKHKTAEQWARAYDREDIANLIRSNLKIGKAKKPE